FPKHGGTGAVWRSLAKHLGDDCFQFNTRVRSIDWKGKVLTTDAGEKLSYDHVLSTMPLDVLAKTLSPTIEPVLEAAPKLLHSHSHIIGVGLTGEMPKKLVKKCWMYF